MKIEIKEQPKADFSQSWYDFKPGVKLLIASANKPSFRRALELNNMQAEQELNGIKSITDESAMKSQSDFARAASHLLLGWTGLENSDGTPFEYNQKNAELLCSASEQALEIIVFVLDKSNLLKVEREKEKADLVGKSSNTTNEEA